MKNVNVNCLALSAPLQFYGMRRDEMIINLMQFEGRLSRRFFPNIKIHKASDFEWN